MYIRTVGCDDSVMLSEKKLIVYIPNQKSYLKFEEQCSWILNKVVISIAPYLDPVPRVANYAYSHNTQASMDNEWPCTTMCTHPWSSQMFSIESTSSNSHTDVSHTDASVNNTMTFNCNKDCIYRQYVHIIDRYVPINRGVHGRYKHTCD